jgi:radical SAM protein (TIGR01212 family)
MDKRYYSINQYCQDTFGEKVYRLSLNGGMTCPNRDGSLGVGGCIFCSEGGSGDFATNYETSISSQIESAKERIRRKTSCKKFIAYFQAYTNTYAPISHLRRIFTDAISHPDIVALSIGTRCDCLPEEVLDLLEELNHIKPVWVELGLQTIHHTTHARLNTHTTVEQYDKVVSALYSRGISVITHVILGLPGENKEMMYETIRHIAEFSCITPNIITQTRDCPHPHFGIKLQLLHILQDTALASQYKKDPFPLFELEEYCDFIIDCLEILPPEMVIHRLTGDGPKKLLIAPLWSTDKKRVLNTIQKRLMERDTWQGNFFINECI